MKHPKRSLRNGKVLLGVMVDPELREKTHLAVRRLSQYGNLTEFIVAKSHEVIEQAGLSLDDIRLLDAHREMVGDVEVDVRAEDYGYKDERESNGNPPTYMTVLNED